MHNLVFIHGRSQEHKDAGTLKSAWLAALRVGLEAAERNLEIDEKRVRFPFYGDRLLALIGAHPENAPEVVIKGPSNDAVKQPLVSSDDATEPTAEAWNELSEKEKQFAAEVMIEAAKELRVSDEAIEKFDKHDGVEKKGPLNWRWTLATMRAISSMGGGGVALSLFTHDVARYLNSSGVRDGIEEGILDSIRSQEPTIVVSHSLGTIIAYNILRREGTKRQWNILTHITLGSPLAIPKIKQALSPISFPQCVKRWMNARDAKDMVALYPLSPARFPAEPITNNNDVKNKTSNNHGIDGYLRDPIVAKWIYEALTQSP